MLVNFISRFEDFEDYEVDNSASSTGYVYIYSIYVFTIYKITYIIYVYIYLHF